MAPVPWVAEFNSLGYDRGILAPHDADYFMDLAAERTGLSDYGDQNFVNPLRIYLRGVENARLSLLGRMLKLQEVLRLLENRLRVEDEITKNPEILAQEVTTPIFIVSQPRAGSSILFELMSQRSGIRSTLFWESIEPAPAPETATYHTDPRIKSTEDAVESWNRLSPDFVSRHLTGPTVPVECIQLMALSFVSAHLAHAVKPADYWLQLTPQDWSYSYKYYKRLLKLLQFKTDAKQWLLKTPQHLYFFPELFATFPDAKVILIHRDPVTTISSTASVLETVHQDIFGAPFDKAKYLENFYIATTEYGLDVLASSYDEMSGKGAAFLNVHYRDIVSNPVEEVTRIYTSFGMTFTEQDRDAVARYVSQRPKDKFGTHSYSLPPEIDIASFREKTARYMHKFDVARE